MQHSDIVRRLKFANKKKAHSKRRLDENGDNYNQQH